MLKITMKPGSNANGDPGQGVLLAGKTYTVSDNLAADLVNRDLARWTENLNDKPAAAVPMRLPGLRIGVLGASTVAYNHCEWKCSVGNYSRVRGVVTAYVNKLTVDIAWLPGRMIRMESQDSPEIEGQFPITSAVTDVNGTTLTWLDPRPDSTGAPTNDMQVADLHSYSLVGAWAQYMNVGLGGRADIIIIGTGSTNLLQWDVSRLQQLTQYGPFDVLILEGLVGNSLLNINGAAASAQAFDQFKQTLINLIELLLPYTRMLVLPTITGNRNITPQSPAFTTAVLLRQWQYTDLVSKYPNVIVAPVGELLASNWQDPTAALDSDVANNLPPYNWMYIDGTHFFYPAATRVGAAQAYRLAPYLSYWIPEMGAMPITRAENSVAELGGKFNPIVGSGQWGNASVKGSPDVGTGQQPTGTTFAVANPGGGMSSVHSILKNPEGGWDWLTLITDTSGSAAGPTFTWRNPGIGAGSLLTIFNDSKNWGKRLRWISPFGLNFQNEGTVKSCEIELYGTTGGIEYHLGALLCDRGLKNSGGTGKLALSNGTIASGGTGYTVGDVLTPVGGTQTQVAKIVVTGVNAGVITRFFVVQPGAYTAAPANAVSVTGGSGTGATFNLVWKQTYGVMDWGLSGNLRSPYFLTIPSGFTFTDVHARTTIVGLPNSVPMGALSVRQGAGQLFEVLG